MKTVSVVVIVCFGMTQLVWAADVRQMLTDAKTAFDAMDDTRRSGGQLTAEQLIEADSQQQNLVEQQNALEDLQNYNFTLTTQNGDLLTYVGNALKTVQRPDGTLLNNIQTDLAGQITSADLRLADGSVQIYQNGAVIGYQLPDGRQVIYENGEVKRVISVSGVETLYSYTKDAQGAVTQTILESPSARAVYDASGRLTEVLNKTYQTTSFYANGALQSIQAAGGAAFMLEYWQEGADAWVAFTGFQSASGDRYTFTNGALTAVTLADGTALDGVQWNPDGSIREARYTNARGDIVSYKSGEGFSVVLAEGGVLSGLSWNPDGSVKDATLTEASGIRYTYQNGVVTRIDRPDGSHLDTLVWAQDRTLASAVLTDPTGNAFACQNGWCSQVTSDSGLAVSEVVWNADGSLRSAVITDASGNRYLYDTGAIVKIVQPDGSYYDDLVWDAQNKIDGARLTLPNGTRYTYQNKKLIEFRDPQNVLTTFTYLADKITAASLGVTHEYLLDGTPSRTVWADGSQSLYNLSGVWKGYRQKDVTSAASYLYEYTLASGGAVTVQKREVLGTIYSSTVIQGTGAQSSSANPFVKFESTFPNDGTIDQSVVASATASKQTLTVTLRAGAGSTYKYNSGSAVSLGVTLQNGVKYYTEIRWQSNGVGIYVYPASGTRPATPQGLVTNKSWSPTFKIESVNVPVMQDATSSGGYSRTATLTDKNGANQPQSPAIKTNFRFLSASTSNAIVLNADQVKVGNITRKLTFSYASNKWTLTRSDTDSSTGQTATTTVDIAQTLTSGVDYTAEVRIENGQASLYVYNTGAGRPAAALGQMSSFDAATKLYASSIKNADSSGQIFKNLTTPASSSVQLGVLTGYASAVQNSTLTRQGLSVASQAAAFTARDVAGVGPRKPMDLLVRPDQALIDAVAGFDRLRYGSDGQIKEAILPDGTRLVFEAGALREAIRPDGQSAQFLFEESGLSNILGTTIVQGGLEAVYSAEGDLSSIVIGDLTVRYREDGSGIDRVERSDGTVLRDLVFNADGSIRDAVILTPDGQERTYQNGVLVLLREPDGTELFYFDDRLTHIITPEQLTYDFAYTPEKIEATLRGTVVPDALTPVRMEYASDFSLKKVVRQNQEILSYLGGDLAQIIPASGAAKEFVYTKDASGKVLSYKVIEGSVETYYDDHDQPIRALIHATAQNPHELEVLYQYGKIRQIKKNGTLIFSYSYRFDDQGDELTDIEDLEEGTLKVYKDGLLLTSLTQETSVLSEYAYADGRVWRVTVTRLGRPLHTYDYVYQGEDTVVTDEEGAVRVYDAQKRLTTLKKNGTTHAYRYVKQSVETGEFVPTGGVLPQTATDTSARSVLSWDPGTSGWMSGGSDHLYTYWGDQWVEYAVTQGQDGELEVALETTNIMAPPPGYPGFQLEFFIDGVSHGVYTAAADPAQWQENRFVIRNVRSGTHTLRMKWLNDAYADSQHDANLSFRHLRMTPVSAVHREEDVTVEELIEKTLSDGSTAHYENGSLSSIDRPDGTRLSEIVLGADRSIVSAQALLTDGTKQVFDGSTILKEVRPDGKTFTYSYDKDASGQITATWIDAGNGKVRYDGAGVLTGLKLNGVLTPAEVQQATQHIYDGGANGAQSFDGNFSTSQSGSISGSGGGYPVTVSSAHTFPTGQSIREITLKMLASGYASGNYITNYEASYYVEVYRNGAWEVVPGTYDASGGGRGSVTLDSGVRRLQGLDLKNVTSIRAVAHGFGNTSDGGGSAGGSAAIYEIQYVLADQSALTFSTLRNAQDQITGYRFDGYPGRIDFDAQGSLLAGTPAGLLPAAQSLAGYMASLAQGPYKTGTAAQTLRAGWYATARSAIQDADAVMVSEFGADGTLETQTKADGTVTLFENEKPSEVLDKDGTLLVKYVYDAAGNISKVQLRNARDTLPDEVLKARLEIEKGRAAQLQALAAQRNLAYQTIQSQVSGQKTQLQSQLNSLQSQYDQISGTKVSGKKAKSQRGDALNQIVEAMKSVQNALYLLNQQEADAYAALDTQVRQVSDQIKADADQSLTALAQQETQLKREILKQEVSPVIYDRYRRILGRDPSSAEYDTWIQKIDYDSGLLVLSDTTQTSYAPGASIALDGAGDSVSVSDSDDFTLGTSDFTMDLWVKFNTTAQSQGLMYHGKGWNDSWQFYWSATSGLKFYSIKNGQVLVSASTPWTPSVGQWTHVALVRSSQTLRFFVNGSQIGSYTAPSAFDIANPQWDLTVGDYVATDWQDRYLNGSLDEVRLSKGIARWTANFTPSTDSYAVDAQTTLLLRARDNTVKDEGLRARFVNKQGNAATSADYKVRIKTVNRVVVTKEVAEAVSEYIQTLPELAERQAYVAAIKQNVANLISAYLAKTQAQKEAYAATLGLSAQDLIALSAADAQKILEWLGSRSLHFGQSAFLSLENLLDQKGISYSREELATRAILIDILSGVISPLDDGDLVISIFSLNKTAALYGLNVSGARLSWDDLLNLFSGNANAIAQLVYSLDQTYGFSMDASGYSENWGGLGEKWFLGTPHEGNNNWYYITPDGKIYAWSGQSAASMRQNGTALDRLIGQASSAYHSDPTLLLNAVNPLPARLIAHINGNHFVIVTAVTADSVTYIDPGIGKDKQNESVTVTKDKFLKVWQGHAFAETVKLQTVVPAQPAAGQSRFLTQQEAMKIRGAFLPLIFAAIAAVVAQIGTAIAAIIATVGSLLASVGAVVQGVLATIGQALTSVAQGIGYLGKALYAGIKFAASTLYQAGQSLFATFGGQSLFGSASQLSFGQQLFQTAVKVGLRFGLSRGLDALGVDPTISGLISSFVTGGYEGFANPISLAQAAEGVTRASMIASSIFESVSLQGIGQLGVDLGLDSSLVNIVSLSLSAIGGQTIQNPSTTLEQAFANIKPDLFNSLTRYGIEKLSTSLGLPVLVGQALGAPIVGALGQNIQNGEVFGQNILQSIQEGMVNAAIGYGIHFATGTISNPLLGSLASRALAGALEGALFRQDMFSGLFEAAKNSVLDLFGRNRQELLSNVVNFNVLISQKGSVSAALEAYAVDIFDQGTIESVVRSGGFAAALAAPKTNITLPDGVAAKQSVLSNGTAVLFDAQGNLLGFRRSGVTQLGTFGITNNGTFGLLNGRIYGLISTGDAYSGTIRDGQAIELKIDISGNELKIEGKDETSLVFDHSGQIVDGSIDFANNAYTFEIQGGSWTDIFVSTAHAAGQQITIYDPSHTQAITLNGFQFSTPGNIAGTRTRTEDGDQINYLAKFVSQDVFKGPDGIEATGLIRADLTSANPKVFTTDSFNLTDTPTEAAYSNQLYKVDPISGKLVFAEERAEYFIVFDREGLVAPEYTRPVEKWINRDGSLANPTLENTGRNEVVFNASTVINLRDVVSEGMQRLIYWGQNSGVLGWWNRLRAFFKIAERGYA